MKTCSKCGEDKRLQEYPAQADCRDGRRPYCKECQRAYNAAYRAKHKERLHAQHRQYRLANLDRVRERDREYGRRNREAQRARSRRHYEENREAYITRAAEWRNENPERMREHRKAWEERYPDRAREYRRYRHQLHQGAAPTLEAREYMCVLEGDPCAYCGAPTEEMDHIHPVAAGGGGEWDNFTPACARCNRLKSDKSLLRFMRERLVA